MTFLGKVWICAFQLILCIPADALFNETQYPAIAAEQRLLEDILKGYEKSIRPAENVTKPVNVKMKVVVVDIINLDEKLDEIHMVIWAEKKWTDVRLAWDPKKYKNINRLNIPNRNIWIPDIVPYYNMQQSYKEMDSMVVVGSNGVVYWVPATHLRLLCTADLTEFPYDKQECSVKIGSWTYDSSQVNLTYLGQPKDAIQVYPDISDDWTVVSQSAIIISTKYDCCEYPYVDMTVKLNLRRNPTFYSRIFIVPAIFLGLLVPFHVFLPPDSKERLTLGSVLLILLMFMNYMLLNTLPNAKSTVPRIQLYYLLTLAWNVLSLITSMIVYNAHFRGPRLKRIPDIIRTIFLGGLSKLVCVCKGELYDIKGIYNPATSASEDGQLGNQTTPDNSKLATDSDQLAVYLQVTSNMAATTESKQRILDEWRQVALVLDRILFVFFLILFIVCSIALVKT